MPFALTPDGVRLYYETMGTGEPLLLVMGQAGDHHGWDFVRGDFAKQYQGTGEHDGQRAFGRNAFQARGYILSKVGDIYSLWSFGKRQDG
ncbi:MAG: hypothetical protein U0350_20090 [Caldilineaceae bacterium]